MAQQELPQGAVDYLRQIAESVGGMNQNLENMATDIRNLNENMGGMNQNLANMTTDIRNLNESMGELMQGF
jgi:methyl-accepting chemotaxis protein